MTSPDTRSINGRRGLLSGLAPKLFLTVILTSTAITAITVVLQLRNDYRQECAAVHASFDEIEASYIPALSLSIFNFDSEQSRLLLQGIHLLRYVSYAEIRETQGEELVVTDSVGEGVPEEHIEQTFDLEYEYEGVTRHLGRLDVYADLGTIRRRVRERLGATVISSAVQVFIVSSLILILVGRLVVTPLRRASRFVRSIDISDDEDSLLTLPRRAQRPQSPQRRDEFDEIVNSINEMKQRLTQTYRELRESKERVETANEQKTVLLRELNHRTKNNMQVIVSLLSMKAAGAPEESEVRELVAETEARVYAMALVHEKLYQSSDLSRIDIQEYLHDLARFLVSTHGDGRAVPHVQVDAAAVDVLFDTVVPCGLIVTELVSNALDHAFDDPSTGTITVSLAEQGDGVMRLCVKDNGRGFPGSFDPKVDANMGIRLVYSLGEQQLGGRVHVETTPGVVWTVEFRDSTYDARV